MGTSGLLFSWKRLPGFPGAMNDAYLYISERKCKIEACVGCILDVAEFFSSSYGLCDNHKSEYLSIVNFPMSVPSLAYKMEMVNILNISLYGCCTDFKSLGHFFPCDTII